MWTPGVKVLASLRGALVLRKSSGTRTRAGRAATRAHRPRPGFRPHGLPTLRARRPCLHQAAATRTSRRVGSSSAAPTCFDHTLSNVELLGQMVQVGAAAHCPFVAGVSPSVMQMETWPELANPRDLRSSRRRSTRPGASSATRRIPGTSASPCRDSSAAIPTARPTASCPLLHRKNTDIAAFIGAPALQTTAEYTDPDATAIASFSGRLPYLFAACASPTTSSASATTRSAPSGSGTTCRCG